jgi:type I restriction enzyme S subunit
MIINLKDTIIDANTGADAIQRAPIVEYDTGKKCLRIGDISNNKKYDDWGFTEVSDENYKKYKLEKDDILIARTGSTIGINKYIDKDYYSVYNNGLIRLKIDKSKYNSKFIYYVIQTKKFKDYINGIAFGTTGQPNMKINDLLKFQFKYVPLKKQNKIAGILSKLDTKINLNNQTNYNLHELAENLFNQVYLVGKDCKLSDLIFNISTGSRPKGGAQESGIPSIGAEKIEKFGIYNYDSEKYISEEYFNKLKNGIVNSGDVLLYKDGAYTGKASMALNGFPHEKCAVNEHVFIINTTNNWAKFYLYFILNKKENKQKIYTMACGKAAQPGLNQVELKSLDIKLANKEDIIEFENKVEPIMNKIAHNSLENRTLEQLRDTLLPRLMNGEIALDNIEI